MRNIKVWNAVRNIGGSDGHADTLQACTAKCDQDANCKFVSFSQGRTWEDTCSRYSASTDCVDRPSGQTDHVSYKKPDDQNAEGVLHLW